MGKLMLNITMRARKRVAVGTGLETSHNILPVVYTNNILPIVYTDVIYYL